MAYAVTHILVPLIIFSLLRHYVFGKGKMPTYVVLIAGLAGLAPDLDIVLTWINHFITGSHTNLHGSFTHSFFLPILFGLIGIAFYTGKQIRATYIWCAVAFGWLTHVLLDVLYRHGIGKALGWPFTNQMTPSCFVIEMQCTCMILLTILLLYVEKKERNSYMLKL